MRALCDPSHGLAARFPTLPRVSIAIAALDRISDVQAERLASGLAALGSLKALHCAPVDDNSDIRGPPAWRHLALLLTSVRQLRSLYLTGLVDVCVHQYDQHLVRMATHVANREPLSHSAAAAASFRRLLLLIHQRC